MNGYIAFYEGQRIEIAAPTQYDAVKIAREHFKIPKAKRYLLSIVLAERNGETVVHSTSEEF